MNNVTLYLQKTIIPFLLLLLPTIFYAQDTLKPVWSTPCIGSGALYCNNDLNIITWSNYGATLWKTQNGKPVRNYEGMTDRISCVAVDSTSLRLLVCDYSGKIYLWDLASGKLLYSIQGYSKGIVSCRFNNTGNIFGTAGIDDVVKLWNTNDGTLRQKLGDSSKKVLGLNFSRTGKIITVGEDYKILLWDESGNKVLQLNNTAQHSLNAFFAKHDSVIVSHGGNGVIYVWNSNTGNLISELKGHSLSVVTCVESNDSKYLASTSYDSQVIVWDLNSFTLYKKFIWHSGYAIASWLQNSKGVVSGGQDGTLKVWMLNDSIPNQPDVLRNVWAKSITCSNDNHSVLVSCENGTVVRIRLDSMKKIHTLHSHGTSPVLKAYFHNKDKEIITIGMDATLKVWDIGDSSVIKSMNTEYQSVIDLSKDHTRCTSNNYDSAAAVFDVITEQKRCNDIYHKSNITSLHFSNKGRMIVSTGLDWAVKVWDADDCTLMYNFTDHTFYLNDVEFSPDDTKLVSAGADGVANIWDVKSGILLQSLTGHKGQIIKSRFNLNGSKIITAGLDGTAKVWDVTSGNLLYTLSGHQSELCDALFNNRGDKIITTSLDSTAKLWDMQGKLIATLYGHHARIPTASFSNDGLFVVTPSFDNAAKLWDANNGKLLCTMVGHSSYIYESVFDSTGKNVLTSCSDGTAKLWDVSKYTSTVGVEEQNQNHNNSTMSIYPSPAYDAITVSFNQNISGNVSVSIVDILGHQYPLTSNCYFPLGNQQIQYEVHDIPTGQYTLLFRANGRTTAKQFIIQR